MGSSKRRNYCRSILVAVSVIVLYSCAPIVGDPAESPAEDDRDTPISLPSFDPATATLSYSRQPSNLHVDTAVAGSISLDRTGTEVIAAVHNARSATGDALQYLPFAEEAWHSYDPVPVGAHGFIALHSYPGVAYVAAGQDLLSVRGAPREATVVASSVLAGVKGARIQAVFADGGTVYVAGGSGVHSVTSSELWTGEAIEPTLISEAGTPVSVMSFARLGDLILAGAAGVDKTNKLYTANTETGVWGQESGSLAASIFDILVLGGTIYAATANGLYSGGPGVKFLPVAAISIEGVDPTVHDLFFDNGVIYAATSDGLWFSPDAGTSWESFDFGTELPLDYDGRGFHSVTALGNRVYVGTDGVGVLELVWQ